VSTFPTTEPETIREALCRRLEAIQPTLSWDRSRWTWQKDAEIMGPLRNFDARFGAETEVGNGDGRLGAMGGGMHYECVVELVTSYPVGLRELDRFIGADNRDISAVLVTLHELVSGMFPQTFSATRRVVSTFTGSDAAFIGTHTFTIEFFALDSVAVAS
jgi:hypothetical protein